MDFRINIFTLTHIEITLYSADIDRDFSDKVRVVDHDDSFDIAPSHKFVEQV
jgi:hypothetical protein